MAVTQNATDNERLAKVEATTEALVREGVDNRQAIRDLSIKLDNLMLESQRNFRWTVGLQITILVLLVIGLFLRT